MKARVKKESRYKMVTAFGGHTYTLVEWSNVPAGCEAEAHKHPFLEVLDESPETKMGDPVRPQFLEQLEPLVFASATEPPISAVWVEATDDVTVVQDEPLPTEPPQEDIVPDTVVTPKKRGRKV